MEAFERYAGLVDDWHAFTSALRRPLKATIWANPSRLDRPRLQALFREEGIASEVMDWHPHGLRLSPSFMPGRHWGLFGGLFQVQEEAAMLPVQLLDPRPGEYVLDLCAAPGNKTAQIATAMQDRGTVVANELKRGRLGALRQTIKRLGLVNVVVTSRPAQEFPLRTGPFDRVLLDAPCSGEGTVRKRPRAADWTDAAGRAHLVKQQQRMLERALRLVRPGGRVVYATCTLAPEENECVVDSVLSVFHGAARVVDVDISALRRAPGVTAWAGKTLDSSLSRTVRLWPHGNDTGGFFVAVLERAADADSCAQRVPPQVTDGRALDAFGAQFGLPAGWCRGLSLTRESEKYLHVVNDDLATPADFPAMHHGLPAIGFRAYPPKPTTALVMRFGDSATDRVVDADGAQAAAFLRRVPFTLTSEQAGGELEAGYVLVRYRGFTIGVGHVRGDGSGGQVASLYPKAWTRLAAVP